MLSELDALPSIQLGEFTLRFELDELTPTGQETALRELRETPENRENGIKQLRNLLKQGELANYRSRQVKMILTRLQKDDIRLGQNSRSSSS